MRACNATTTSDKAATHDTTMPLLDSMYSEFKELSKKKPDAAVSKSKINIANRLLARVREHKGQANNTGQFLSRLLNKAHTLCISASTPRTGGPYAPHSPAARVRIPDRLPRHLPYRPVRASL